MTYEEALEELEEWGDLTYSLTEGQVMAVAAAKRALKDCLEMGLTGEGE